MKRQELVVDLVKAAFIVLIVKVMATSSTLIPWNDLIDGVCITFALGVMLAKVIRFNLSLGRLFLLTALGSLILYTCVTMGQYDLVITMVTILLLIDEDLEEYITLMMRVEIAFLILHVTITGVLTLAGSGDAYWSWTDQRLRFDGGLAHANILSSYVLSCMLMFAWKHFHRITPNQFLAMALITVLTFLATRSRTGLLLNCGLLVLIFLTQNEYRLITWAVDVAVPLVFPALSALVYWSATQYQGGNSIVLLMDKLLTGRLKYASYAYHRSGTTWLPRFLDYAESGVVSWAPGWNLNTFTFDNVYSFLFMQMGMLWLGVISLLILFASRRLDFRNRLFILIWALYSMVEVHGLNCFKFFPLLLLTTLLSRKGAEDHPTSND